MHLLLVGISHKTAPVELRERLRVKLDQLEIQVETREYLP